MKSIGRNQPCPCGSGKKYKHCHGSHPSPTKDNEATVIRNPDGSIDFSTKISSKELGPAFGYKEIITVPEFDERDMKPGETQPTPVGNPGMYEVTYIFSRPDLGITKIQKKDLDILNGDSALVITTPEPRPRNQLSGVQLDISYLSKEGNKKECAIMLRPNKHGRLSFAVTTFQALSYRDARDNANRALLPFLSKLSFENNVPLEVRTIVTRELSTGGQNTEFRIPFPFQTLLIPSEGQQRADILALLSFYREGMNSTSISYSFLCFYRILEAIYSRRKEVIKTKRVRYAFKRENRLTEADLLGLTTRMSEYKEFIGKKFRSIYENTLTPLRISIAHGLLGEENPIENTPDDISLRNRVGFLTPIVQILARLEIQNELNHENIPLSNNKQKNNNGD